VINEKSESKRKENVIESGETHKDEPFYCDLEGMTFQVLATIYRLAEYNYSLVFCNLNLTRIGSLTTCSPFALFVQE
jgi:hypothetical protein